MGLFSFLAKLIVFGIILALSYIAAGLLLDLVTSASSAMDVNASVDSPFAVYSYDTLAGTVCLCVGVFFTIPASLALVGRAGVWIKHVASRSIRLLGAAFLCASGVYIVSTAALGFTLNFSRLEPETETILLATAVAALFLLLVSKVAFLRTGAVAYDGIAGLTHGLRNRGLSSSTVELKTMPTKPIREKEKPERVRSEAVKFQRLLQSLTSMDWRVEFRLSFIKGRGRDLISAFDHEPAPLIQQRLLSMVKAHLPEYAPVPSTEKPVFGGIGRSVPMSGVPEAVENPLEPLSRYFLENSIDGEYVLVVERSRANLMRRLAAKAEQRSTARKSGGQLTKQDAVAGEQESAPVRDHAEEMRLEESMKAVERHHSPLALSSWVWVTCYGASREDAEMAARGASSVIVGALSGHRQISALRVGPPRDPPESPGGRWKDTVLLPGEAVPFAWIPQLALGTAVVPSAEFELPPRLDGEITLGKVVSGSGPTAHEVRIPLDALTKHAFVTGMTGTGKTNSCISLLLRLYRLGIPFLVIEPVKSEYRSLLSNVPPLQVFTLGDEETAPFRLNIFEPPARVRVQTHLENLVAAWNASFVMYSPLPLVAGRVFEETYHACGWDIRRDRRGRPITLDDLLVQTERVSRELGYEPKVTMDIEAALRTRVTNLMLGSKGPMFDCAGSIPVEELMRKPTVIELGSIPNDEEKAFTANLLLMNVAQHVETRGHSRQLRHLTLIEEAHRLLPNVSTQKGDPEGADPRKRMVEQFGNMLAEVRAYGEGIAIVEQIPTKILPDAIKNTATKVAHRVPAADDRKVLAGAMNLTEEQEQVFPALGPGGAIVSLEGHAFPIRVQVEDVVRRLGLPVGEMLDEEVKRHMADFYLRVPLPKAVARRGEEMLALVDAPWFGDRFREAYRAWLEKGEMGLLAGLMIDGAGKFSEDGEERLRLARRLLEMSVGRYLPFDEKDRERFPRMFMRQVERSMRDDRRA